ncbi:hypothetical protein MPTK1_7g09140 [Marchantia polymorpha subsp. ruderalis]|uniref:Uncharacterized protein n=2 Tax=Marchantia polymorpha TaxID=3197 RepID=A0AAF6BXN6_MARPO|nr:hypothetical protein MARPO_0068s0067 [Marchantia polymorpha]BBN16770.1 hypothetical protein Mp_7g09140 [Marchantia polymorpha subsp. ruderalis]|eukprot:PTQ35853.1 hypothetical protein MARPO_0068s0067 [Marchantia polymorpha]
MQVNGPHAPVRGTFWIEWGCGFFVSEHMDLKALAFSLRLVSVWGWGARGERGKESARACPEQTSVLKVKIVDFKNSASV